MASTERFSDRFLDAGHQLLIDFETWAHEEKQDNGFV
jgi:hypothetical protein